MGLSVSLGIERFWLDEEEAEQVLRTVLETGSVDKVRSTISRDGEPDRFIELVRKNGDITSRVLSDEESRVILDAIKTLKEKYGAGSATFTWDEAESLAFDVQDFAVAYGKQMDPMEKHEFKIGSDRVRMISIERSQKLNWTGRSRQCNFARAIHKLAERHHLVVHSA